MRSVLLCCVAHENLHGLHTSHIHMLFYATNRFQWMNESMNFTVNSLGKNVKKSKYLNDECDLNIYLRVRVCEKAHVGDNLHSCTLVFVFFCTVDHLFTTEEFSGRTHRTTITHTHIKNIIPIYFFLHPSLLVNNILLYRRWRELVCENEKKKTKRKLCYARHVFIRFLRNDLWLDSF